MSDNKESKDESKKTEIKVENKIIHPISPLSNTLAALICASVTAVGCYYFSPRFWQSKYEEYKASDYIKECLTKKMLEEPSIECKDAIRYLKGAVAMRRDNQESIGLLAVLYKIEKDEKSSKYYLSDLVKINRLELEVSDTGIVKDKGKKHKYRSFRFKEVMTPTLGFYTDTLNTILLGMYLESELNDEATSLVEQVKCRKDQWQDGCEDYR